MRLIFCEYTCFCEICAEYRDEGKNIILIQLILRAEKFVLLKSFLLKKDVWEDNCWQEHLFTLLVLPDLRCIGLLYLVYIPFSLH